jgi:hypothetical protein
MSNIFSVSSTHGDARRARLDVVTAAMLNGGASGGWLMARALKPVASRCLYGARRAARSTPVREPSFDARAENGRN